MKKHRFHILPVITCIFSAFMLGFFCGRNISQGDILISGKQSGPSYAMFSANTTVGVPSADQEPVLFPLNINTAAQNELMTLPGIGEVLAQRILEYREQNGNFSNTAELMNVEGIGSAKLEAILDLITTGG